MVFRNSTTCIGMLYDESEKELEKAIRINPNDIQSRLELNDLRFQITKNKKTAKERKKVIENARELIKDTVKIDPNNGAPDKAYALMIYANKQSDKVFKESEKVLGNALLRLDESKRWQFHLTLSHLLLQQGEKINQSRLRWVFYFLASRSKLAKERKTFRSYCDGALEEANKAKSLQPTHPDPYFLSGIIHCKLKEYKNAIEDFELCRKSTSDKNELYLKVKRHINYIRPFVTSKVHTKWSIKKATITFLIIVIIAIISYFYVFYDKIDHSSKISIKEFISTALILGLIIPCLPFLKRFKLPGGLEAEMKPLEIKPPEISLGPTGEIRFGSLLPTITSGPLGIGGKMNWPATTTNQS